MSCRANVGCEARGRNRENVEVHIDFVGHAQRSLDNNLDTLETRGLVQWHGTTQRFRSGVVVDPAGTGWEVVDPNDDIAGQLEKDTDRYAEGLTRSEGYGGHDWRR